jgi:hypothetical protein
MHLKLNHLQKLVDRTVTYERAVLDLKVELGRVLGPVIVTEGQNLQYVATAANDRLDVLDRTGKSGSLAWNPRVSAPWLDHKDPEVRKLAARICPERFLQRMSNDPDPDVRATVGKRIPLLSLREMIKRHPDDDQLQSTFRQRRLHEAGVPKPKVQPMGIDPIKGAKRMGDVARTQPGPELGETWYRDQAMRFMHEYGQNIEYAWEELAVHRFCSSTRATSGVKVDEARLLKNIKELIKEKEDMAMERNALRETLKWLARSEEQEQLDEGVISTTVMEDVDPVTKLVSAGMSNEQFVQSATTLFQIKEGMLPMSIRKYRLGEGNARQTMVPVVGTLPHAFGFRSIDERALNSFCEAWTRRQNIQGEPLQLEWTTHPSDVNKIGFTCYLK